MNRSPRLTRRDALTSLTVSAAAAASHPRCLEAAAAEQQKPTLHVYSDFGWLRGMNCIPSWAARIEEAWWNYDGARMREEVALARSIHCNTIRLWIEFTAWMADPDKVTSNFMDAVAAIDESGMKTMPCLFNRWHDRLWDYGGTYIDNLRGNYEAMVAYVRSLVKPLAGDSRILCWDLCNEPQWTDLAKPEAKAQFEWLRTIATAVRESGAQQPIVIGTMFDGNITTFAPLVDVLCAHPYARDRASLDKLIAEYKEMVAQYKKPLLVNECVPGSDVDQTRAETGRYYLEMLSAAGFGWMPWSIKEGRAVATRRDRMDGNGIDGKGFHATFTRNNKLRAGHEYLLEKPKLLAPWERG